jgi:hypothetical protein
MLRKGVLLHVHSSHTRELLRALAGLILAPVLAAAQATSSLPSAPQPQPQQQHAPQAIPQAAPQNAPIVTMATHHGNDRYWLSGQANIIFQGNLPFHSPYVGTNSFRGASEYKTSLLGTLYTALRPTRSIRYNTDFLLDLESSGGRGLSQALGLAGFTNLDVVRNPTLAR